MKPDIETQRHAQIIARQYNLCDVTPLKTERATTPGSPINSVWLATHDGNTRCFVQYDQDELPD